MLERTNFHTTKPPLTLLNFPYFHCFLCFPFSFPSHYPLTVGTNAYFHAHKFSVSPFLIFYVFHYSLIICFEYFLVSLRLPFLMYSRGGKLYRPVPARPTLPPLPKMTEVAIRNMFRRHHKAARTSQPPPRRLLVLREELWVAGKVYERQYRFLWWTGNVSVNEGNLVECEKHVRTFFERGRNWLWREMIVGEE